MYYKKEFRGRETRRPRRSGITCHGFRSREIPLIFSNPLTIKAIDEIHHRSENIRFLNEKRNWKKKRTSIWIINTIPCRVAHRDTKGAFSQFLVNTFVVENVSRNKRTNEEGIQFLLDVPSSKSSRNQLKIYSSINPSPRIDPVRAGKRWPKNTRVIPAE